MGFPVPYAGVLPKLLLTTAISVAAIKEFCRSLLQLVGLCREDDTSEVLWQFTAEMELEMNSRMCTLGSSIDDIRESLPPVLFEVFRKQHPEREDAQCAVCLFDLDKGQEVRQLPYCCHIFHKDCIDRWLDHDQKTCPLCRSSLMTEEAAQKVKQRERELSDELNFWFASYQDGEGLVEPLYQDTGYSSVEA